MMMNFLMMLMLLMTMTFIQSPHPLSMILILIMQTITGTILMNMVMQFPWFSYMLILVFLGGMMILFMYMSNLVSNEMFYSPNNMKMKLIYLPQIMWMMFMLLNNHKLMNNQMTKTFNENSEFTMNLSKPFSLSIMPLTITMAMFIILSLLVIIKMVNMSQGPLRLM